MKYIIERCKRLGIGFRKNKKTAYRYRYILMTKDRGVIGFDYLEDCKIYLDCYEFEKDFTIEYLEDNLCD